MTRTRKAVAWGLGVPLVLLVLLLVVIAMFDWNSLKPTINEKASAALQRPFAIEGNLGVSWHREKDQSGWRGWIPWPHITAEDVSLGNPDWAGRQPFVHLMRVDLRISPLALLHKQIYIPRIDLTGPDANIERKADGRNSWTFETNDAAQPQKTETDEESAWTFDIGTIGFDAGHVRFDDEVTQTDVSATVTSLDAPIAYADIVGQQGSARQRADIEQTQDFQFALNINGTYQGVPIEGKGQVGGLLALQDADQPFPVQLEARAADTQIRFIGTLTEPQRLGSLDLRLRLSGPTLAQLYRLTGVALPETGPYSTDGHLVVVLNDPQGPRFRYEGFSGRIGDSDIHGDIQYVSAKPRSKLSGTLRSEQLLFADLAPLIGADSPDEQKARGAATEQPADKVLPVSTFDTQRWRTMDADVRFEGKRIVQNEALPITDMNTHIRLTDGELLLDPLRFGVAGGALNATVRLEGNRTPLQARLDVHARRVKLKELFPSVDTMRNSLGELNGDATLTGTGNSVATLLGSSDGELKLLMNDGRISGALMEIAGLNVGNYLVDRLFGDDTVDINCAVTDLAFKRGLVEPRVFVFDTENALINVDGQVNLATEQLNLSIEPHSKGMRIFSLRSPLYVRGTLKNPSPGVQAVPLAARGAIAVILGTFAAPAAGLLALVAPSGGQESQCGALLEQMRGNR